MWPVPGRRGNEGEMARRLVTSAPRIDEIGVPKRVNRSNVPAGGREALTSLLETSATGAPIASSESGSPEARASN